MLQHAQDYSIQDSQKLLTACVVHSGADLTIALYGGDAPHVGCVVLAIPRASLTGNGLSATVSCINCVGHKDDEVARSFASCVASTLNVTVACSCGIHVDDASQGYIEAICAAGKELAQILVEKEQEMREDALAE